MSGRRSARAPAETIHASAVALAGRGCLILGKAGSGKTTLALEMMALGASLVADDRVEVARLGAGAVMSPPARLAGLVEVRGAGVLRVVEHASRAPLWLAADLDAAAGERMPRAETRRFAGADVRVIACRGRPAAAATLCAILRAGRLPDPELAAGGEAP